MRLTRNLYVPCLDTSRGVGDPNWVPIDLSTVFELGFNPNTETYSYICYANDSTEITSYAAQLPQEIVLDNSNPMYQFVYPLLMGMPTGSSAKVPFLLVEPDMATGQPTAGRMWPEAILEADTLATVDGKISFNIDLNGDPQVGTVSRDGGRIAFTATDPDAVSSVTLDKATATVQAGQTVVLNATVNPPTATAAAVTAESSDTDKATVSVSGRAVTVSGVAATESGSPVTVTVTCGGKSATCAVTVSPKA